LIKSGIDLLSSSNLDSASLIGVYHAPWYRLDATDMLWQLETSLAQGLIVAVPIFLVLKDYMNGTVIFTIVAFNAILGMRQEYQAGQAITVLKKHAVSTIKVRRDDRIQEILARQLIPVDIVLLDMGNLVAADHRPLGTVISPLKKLLSRASRSQL